MLADRIYHGDCLEIMKYIPEKSIDMVLTSPPYDNLRTYSGNLNWNENIWKSVIKELFRVIKIGGVVVWVVGDATIKGNETGTSFKQALYFKHTGFNLHDTMIWNKGNFTAVGALKKSYAPVFEFMFVFSKGSLKTFNPIKDRKNKHAGTLQHGTVVQVDGTKKRVSSHNNRIFKEFGQRHNIWEIPPCKQRIAHSARFPEKLAQDHILSWSNEGDIILDPFAGSGTVGKMAKQFNRNFILIEEDIEYIRIIKNRVLEKS